MYSSQTCSIIDSLAIEIHMDGLQFMLTDVSFHPIHTSKWFLIFSLFLSCSRKISIFELTKLKFWSLHKLCGSKDKKEDEFPSPSIVYIVCIFDDLMGGIAVVWGGIFSILIYIQDILFWLHFSRSVTCILFTTLGCVWPSTKPRTHTHTHIDF